jgi:hypothetical protein
MTPSQQESILKPAGWMHYRYPFIYGQPDTRLRCTLDRGRRSIVIVGVQVVTTSRAANQVALVDQGLQEQVRETLVNAILSGIFAADTPLPSCRQLASQLRVSRRDSRGAGSNHFAGG